MAKQPTQKKQPFVIEPLNLVAPEARNEEVQKRAQTKQATPVEESQD